MTDWGAIEGVLEGFSPIGLDKMKTVRLMNRVDRKYIMARSRLSELLEQIASEYYVQRIEGAAVQRYCTRYYDTEDLEMYRHHHNRQLKRQKVRIRSYMSAPTLTTFFEIKNRNNRKQTKKIRIEVPRSIFDTALEHLEIRDFLVAHTPYRCEELREQLENTFGRFTLVDKGMTERVTIDSDVVFQNLWTGCSVDMSRLAILEVKQEMGAPVSAIERALLLMRVHPQRISKYCIGTVLTNDACKYNRFKERVRLIERLTDGQCAPQSPNRHLFS